MWHATEAPARLGLLTAALLLTATAALRAQTTWYVDDDAPSDPGPGDPGLSDPLENGSPQHPFDAIQEGLDAASAGHTVLVLDGTYTGIGNRDLDFHGKAITVRAESGPQSCVIDCQGRGRGFFFHSAETGAAIVEGFTITGGYVSGSSGAALLCSLRSAPTIRNCIITGNTAQGQWGGGISCIGNSNPVLTDCIISANAAASGGGISSENSSPAFIHCTIAENTVQSSGGGISCGGGRPTLVNCTLVANEADSGGGIRCSSGLPVLIGCLIAVNTARSLSGGGMYSSGAPMLVNCTIADNVAYDYGGAIYCFNSHLTLSNCVVWNNAASIPGLVLWWDSELTISYSDVENGQAGVYVAPNCTLHWGDGNIAGLPRFADPASADYLLTGGSPCIDAADNAALPADGFDLDGDGDTLEPLPVDAAGNPRLVDDPGMPDAGNGTPPLADMGAYEFQGQTCFGDLDGDNQIALSDLAALLSNYGMADGAVYGDGDLERDGDVDLADLSALLSVYGSQCP